MLRWAITPRIGVVKAEETAVAANSRMKAGLRMRRFRRVCNQRLRTAHAQKKMVRKHVAVYTPAISVGFATVVANR